MPRFILCAFAIPIVLAASSALATDRIFDAEHLDGITGRMQALIDDGKIAGAVTLVATPDDVVHLEATGHADIATDRKMQKDTIFRIASMTKTITSAALMLLVEQGKLDPLDPVSKYIPAFKDQQIKGRPDLADITVAEIMTHTAGLNRPSRQERGSLTLEEHAALVASRPLEFVPGSRWQYSSGITVAGRLIEVASGQKYETFLEEHIFKPLGMADTTFRLSSAQAVRLATTYVPGGEPKSLAAVDIPDPTVQRPPNPSGGLYSTASDMARFYQAVLRDAKTPGGERRLLKHETAKQMLTPLTGDLTVGFTPGNQWALGWCVVRHPQGVTRLLSPGTFGHGGAYGTQAWVDPQREMILVLMIQRQKFGNADGSDVRDEFTETAIKSHRGTPSTHAGFTRYHNYTEAVELKRGKVRAVLCPQAGGRVLEFSYEGRNAMWLDDGEKDWQPGKKVPMSAGRFDIGPELVTPPRPKLWSGEWTAEITGPYSARLISERDWSVGVQLIRDFSLEKNPNEDVHPYWLKCTQTIINISNETREFCHWGRSFSPGGGTCFIPLEGRSRFPGKYAMYEDRGVINVNNKDDNIRQRGGFLEIKAPPRKPKLGFDSQAGCIAYLTPSRLAFIKRFRTYPDRPYNEAAGLTLSVWYPKAEVRTSAGQSRVSSRIELEPIGPAERLGPGESAQFTEDWWVLPYAFPGINHPVDTTQIRSLIDRYTVSPN